VTTEAKIIAHLEQKWSPDLILLGGSRALNQHSVTSDWDLYLVGDYSERDSFPEQFDGEHLDVSIWPRRNLSGNVLRIYYGPVPTLRVLKESLDQLGSRIVEQTALAYRQGPDSKNKKALLLERDEMSRMIAKISSHLYDPEACFTNLGFFHRTAVQMWFETRGKWSLPPFKALPIIRIEDPEFALSLSILASEAEITQKLQSCMKIQDALWASF